MLLALAFILVTIWIPAAQSKELAASREVLNCGTDVKPCVVKIIPPSKDIEQSEREQRDAESKRNIDKQQLDFVGQQTSYIGNQVLVGWLQLAVFFLQLVAFCFQAIFMSRTLREVREATKVSQDLAKSARDSADIADRTAKNQLKAYMAIDIAHFEPPRDTASPWYIHVAVKNFGQTPASSLIVKTEYKIAPQENGHPVFPLSINAQTHPKAYFAPGHQQTVRIHCPEMGIGGNQKWDEFGHANYKAYLWGRIDYIDCFEEPRFLTFQMLCHFGQVTGFAQCAVGNESN
jgi:hypothetical protein